MLTSASTLYDLMRVLGSKCVDLSIESMGYRLKVTTNYETEELFSTRIKIMFEVYIIETIQMLIQNIG